MLNAVSHRQHVSGPKLFPNNPKLSLTTHYGIQQPGVIGGCQWQLVAEGARPSSLSQMRVSVEMYSLLS